MSEENKTMQQDITRRGFLGGAAAIGLALPSAFSRTATAQTAIVPKDETTSPTSNRAEADRIDIHHHFVPPAYKTEVDPKSPLQKPVRLWTPEKTLADMQEAGTATAVLSIAPPGLWFGEAVASRKLSRTCNEYAARMVADHPGRFKMFVALPLPDIDGALREIEYGLDTLKASGVGFFTSYDGKYLGHPSYAPLLEELNRRKAILYTHPVTCPSCVGLVPEINDRVIEFGTDTTRTIASLLFSGAAARYPGIHFIFSHAGGTMPFLIERFQDAAKAPEMAQRLPKGLMYELQRFYYDTAQSANPAAMSALSKVVPISQVLFGSDFPYKGSSVQVAGLHKCGFSPQELKAIERENALRLLKET
jgi:predicted TIM-barrel fold metal-dependent hydrolase